MNYIISAFLSFGIIVVGYFFDDSVLHWFLLPVWGCGILIGADAVAWFRGQLDTFDIKGLIGVFGFHFFFLSPIVFISGSLQTSYIESPTDWRYWIGFMGLINLVSLVAYNLLEYLGGIGVRPLKTTWCFSPGRSTFVLGGAIVLSFAAQAYVLFRFGGYSGISAALFSGNTIVFAGAGIPRMMANSSPLLCMFGFLLLIRHTFRWKKNIISGLALLFLFSTIQFAMTGTYSSRGLVVTAIFWSVVLLHYFWRPLNAKFLLSLFAPMIVISWLYTFYKDLGPQVFEYLKRDDAIQLLEKKTGRSLAGVLIGDFSRVDVHAYMLYRLVTHPEEYDFRYGLTYLGDFAPIIPMWIWRGKPASSGKVIAGTELLWGRGFYDEGERYHRATRAYGVGGEMMLNFGPWAVPFAYGLWGFLVGRFRRFIRNMPEFDLRRFVVPYLIWLIPNMLAWDMDNWLAHTMNRAAFPVLIIWLAADKNPLSIGFHRPSRSVSIREGDVASEPTYQPTIS